MRILFAGLALPYPPMNGHRLRTWAMVRALAEEGHRLTVVSFAEPDEMHSDLRPLRDLCADVELIPTPKGTGTPPLEAYRRIAALPAPMPFGASKFRSAAFAARLRRHLDRERFDAIVCDGVYNMHNVPRTAVPVVLNKDDVAHLIIRRYIALERRVLRRLYGRLEAVKVRRWEQRTMRSARIVLACSEFDGAVLRRLCPTATIRVVPNVVDTEHYAPRPGGETATVLFQGGMDWHPNRDAVEYFARDILPALRRLAPHARFRIAGRSPSEVFRRQFDDTPGLEFTGTVADMRDEIAKATVCVVPLRIGSGTRLKILEAGAMAKPIVSTTLGAEGLDLIHGDDIVIADDPHRFAAAVADLLTNSARRERLGRGVRLQVQKHYSLSTFQAAMREAMADIAR